MEEYLEEEERNAGADDTEGGGREEWSRSRGTKMQDQQGVRGRRTAKRGGGALWEHSGDPMGVYKPSVEEMESVFIRAES